MNITQWNGLGILIWFVASVLYLTFLFRRADKWYGDYDELQIAGGVVSIVASSFFLIVNWSSVGALFGVKL